MTNPHLNQKQKNILFHKLTEAPFSNPLLEEKREGAFFCANCHSRLFLSDTKFESGSGWPSFFEPLEDAVLTQNDTDHGMERTEVICGTCRGHLGHVFDDAYDQPGGQRYCINGSVLEFRADE
jgi:peptide-methionine (R)-S-oxide reductase